MLVGIDLRKERGMLEAAYDDDAGVTAAFSLNLLVRANLDLGTDFDTAAFKHQARYDERTGCVAIHLRSTRAQTVLLGERSFAFAAGELLHIEDSWKYTVEGFCDLAHDAGFSSSGCWTDQRQLFSIHLLRCDR